MNTLFETSISKSAKISPCGLYRYELTRRWDFHKAPVVWIMLNPSTADANVDDPTIRRCMGFARDWGYGGIFVANLFCLRSPSPDDLYTAEDPIGPDADETLWLLRRAEMIVAAWGVHGVYRNRDREVAETITRMDRTLWCLGTTKDGHPRHPLYVKGDTKPVPFKAPASGPGAGAAGRE